LASLGAEVQLTTEAKASNRVLGETDLVQLVEALMVNVLETTGADLGLLFIPRAKRFVAEALAKAGDAGIVVIPIHSPIATTKCPQNIINSVIHTRERIIIDDASQPETFIDDDYLQEGAVRSVLCLPLLRHGKLVAVLYLESSCTTGTFTPERIAGLEQLAPQAATSLEIAYLHNDLRESETKFHSLMQKIQVAVVVHAADTQILSANLMAQVLLGLSEAQLLGKTAIDPAWHLLREEGSRMPQEEYPVNRVLASRSPLQNYVVGIDRPDREGPLWALVSGIPIFDEADNITQVIVSFTDVTEQKKAEHQLADSEQLFRTLVENSPDHISRYDLNLRRIYLNPAVSKLFKASSDDVFGQTSMVASPLIDPESYMDNLRRVIESGQELSDEIGFQTPQGEIRWASARFAPEFDHNGKVQSVLVISSDTTKQKIAEFERLDYMGFLESLDRINRVFQTDGDIEEVLQRALKEVLDIFDCDRAYLAYPGDPEAETWSVQMESTRPEYPGILQQQPQPMNDSVSSLVQALLELNHPVAIGPGGQYPMPEENKKKFNIQSDLVMILRPRIDKPWLFGMQQCSHARIWSDQEIRLFEEISHRLSDSLNNLLITSNLGESEARFRLLYESTPVSIQEEDYSTVKSYLDSLRPEFGDDLRAYLEQHPEVVDKCAALVRVIDINHASLALHEADNKEAILRGLPETFIPETQTAYRDLLVALMAGDTSFRMESEIQTLTGRRQDVDAFISVCPGYEKSLGKVLVSLIDITQRKQDEDSLRLAASVFSTSQEGILICDTDNRIIDINPAFTELTGYSREEALGQNPGFLSAGLQDQRFYAEMWKSINATGEWQGELWNRRKSGEVFPERLSIIAVRDDQGKLQRYVGAFSDISMIKQHEADLERIAHYDMLTSIPNRRLLGDQLEKAIAHSRRSGKNLAVCYLDLDGFKPINDQFGHQGGDRMLVEIARRLESMSRGEDTVARLGGDEFVLLWSDIGSEADCVKALERILNKVAEPMLLQDQPVSVSASIGVTLYPDDNVDADSLLRHADHAMYTAKQLGKNRYQIFDARLERQISAQVELMEKIDRGLERGQFELYYQPKVDYLTGQVVGVEALLRWNDPVLGLVGPKEFISLIENDSMAFRMGSWVMGQAVRQAKIWHEQGIRLPISINVFPRHLKHRTFVVDLRSAIVSNWPQMPGNLLILEIVETIDLEELEPIEQVIRQCMKMGIRFSLDDFGTGYSSLVYLRRLSIQELKIDRSFVRDMLDDPEDEAIVVGVISLGQAFGLQVVAEGVETIEQAQHLTDLGCPIIQGYGLGRPMPAHSLEKWYADFNALELKVCSK
jgi:diguanylate cyclase (GGDEF)-like protein/PAS domain S-box-containing protein